MATSAPLYHRVLRIQQLPPLRNPCRGSSCLCLLQRLSDFEVAWQEASDHLPMPALRAFHSWSVLALQHQDAAVVRHDTERRPYKGIHPIAKQ